MVLSDPQLHLLSYSVCLWTTLPLFSRSNSFVGLRGSDVSAEARWAVKPTHSSFFRPLWLIDVAVWMSRWCYVTQLVRDMYPGAVWWGMMIYSSVKATWSSSKQCLMAFRNILPLSLYVPSLLCSWVKRLNCWTVILWIPEVALLVDEIVPVQSP